MGGKARGDDLGPPRRRPGAAARGRRGRRWAAAGLAALLAVALLAFAVRVAFRDLRAGRRGLADLAGSTPTNVLLIGNNARDPASPIAIGAGGGGQADVLMLVHLDPAHHVVDLVSIPRDLLFAMPHERVPIPKIKTLFFLGAEMRPNRAAELTVAGVERFTGMPVDGYVVSDFQGFVDAVDAVGGVRVDVASPVFDPAYSGAVFAPGWQTLDGAQALAYVRVRQNRLGVAGSNDFERMDAEAQVLTALKSKLLDPASDVRHLAALIRTWREDVATDLGLPELLRLALAVRGDRVVHVMLAGPGDSLDVASAPAPGLNAEGFLTGAYYDVVDPRRVYRLLRPLGSRGVWTGVDLPDAARVSVVTASPAVAARLRADGFRPRLTADAPGALARPTVLYPPGHLAWGLAVGRALGAGDTWVAPGTDPTAVVVVP